MQPFSPHSRFFSSLNQLEQRLSSEKDQHQEPPSPSSSPPFSSPLYLSDPKPHNQPPITTTTTTTTTSSSGPPLDFLSTSPITTIEPQEEEDSPLNSNPETEADDIETLMGLLGLSIPQPSDKEKDDGSSSPSSCSCDCSGGGFYKKVVGVKGPRCEREMGRLDRWIGVYCRERREPARLAHLMIGKSTALVVVGLRGLSSRRPWRSFLSMIRWQRDEEQLF